VIGDNNGIRRLINNVERIHYHFQSRRDDISVEKQTRYVTINPIGMALDGKLIVSMCLLNKAL